MKITRKHGTLIAITEAVVFCGMIVWLIYAVCETGLLSTDVITSVATSATVVLLYYTLKWSRQASEDAERPHLSVMLSITADTNRVLVIANSGKSTAIKTKLSLVGVKEGLRVASKPTSNHEIYYLDNNPLFSEGADLPVGWLYEFLLMHGEDYANDPDEQKHPRRFTIKARYEALNGTIYEDAITIDISAHRHSIVPPHSSAMRINQLRKTLKEDLASIRREISGIRRAVEKPPTDYEDGTPRDTDQ
jgi:hypothetical protein